MKRLQDADSRSTGELFTDGFDQLRKLRNRVETRRGREQAMELGTELFLTINAIVSRVAGITFTEAPVAVEDDEEGEDNDGRVSMAELMGHGAEEHAGDEVEGIDDVEVLRQMVRDLQGTRLDYFRLLLAYFAQGCRHEVEVTKRIVAVVRRLSPHLLQQFGLSQADVARRFAETRAAVSVREKVRVERPLKEAGSRGILSNGARSEATSRACARAARGNQNRRAKGRRGSAGVTPENSQPNHTSETSKT